VVGLAPDPIDWSRAEISAERGVARTVLMFN
jgi:hypothetical protein